MPGSETLSDAWSNTRHLTRIRSHEYDVLTQNWRHTGAQRPM